MKTEMVGVKGWLAMWGAAARCFVRPPRSCRHSSSRRYVFNPSCCGGWRPEAPTRMERQPKVPSPPRHRAHRIYSPLPSPRKHTQTGAGSTTRETPRPFLPPLPNGHVCSSSQKHTLTFFTHLSGIGRRRRYRSVVALFLVSCVFACVVASRRLVSGARGATWAARRGPRPAAAPRRIAPPPSCGTRQSQRRASYRRAARSPRG